MKMRTYSAPPLTPDYSCWMIKSEVTPSQNSTLHLQLQSNASPSLKEFSEQSDCRSYLPQSQPSASATMTDLVRYSHCIFDDKILTSRYVSEREKLLAARRHCWVGNEMKIALPRFGRSAVIEKESSIPNFGQVTSFRNRSKEDNAKETLKICRLDNSDLREARRVTEPYSRRPHAVDEMLRDMVRDTDWFLVPEANAVEDIDGFEAVELSTRSYRCAKWMAGTTRKFCQLDNDSNQDAPLFETLNRDLCQPLNRKQSPKQMNLQHGGRTRSSYPCYINSSDASSGDVRLLDNAHSALSGFVLERERPEGFLPTAHREPMLDHCTGSALLQDQMKTCCGSLLSYFATYEDQSCIISCLISCVLNSIRPLTADELHAAIELYGAVYGLKVVQYYRFERLERLLLGQDSIFKGHQLNSIEFNNPDMSRFLRNFGINGVDTSHTTLALLCLGSCQSSIWTGKSFQTYALEFGRFHVKKAIASSSASASMARLDSKLRELIALNSKLTYGRLEDSMMHNSFPEMVVDFKCYLRSEDNFTDQATNNCGSDAADWDYHHD